MRVGAILVCDAVRPREDGLFDAIGAGQQVVVLNRAAPSFDRTLAVQLLCGPEDVGVGRKVHVVLMSERGRALAGAGIEVTAGSNDAAPDDALPRLALWQVIRLTPRLEEEGTYHVVISTDDEILGGLALRVAFRDLASAAGD